MIFVQVAYSFDYGMYCTLLGNSTGTYHEFRLPGVRTSLMRYFRD